MQDTEKISGYARVMAKLRVQQEVNKPFLGKPYLKYGQCYALWSYFFQLGGILGAKHSAKLDAFGHAFLGMWGPSGSLANFFAEVAECIVSDYVRDSMTFADFVAAEFIRRIDYRGDAQRFFYEQGMNKLPTDTAQELAWQYSQQGAALGITYPDIVRRMFEQTHAAVPKIINTLPRFLASSTSALFERIIRLKPLMGFSRSVFGVIRFQENIIPP